MNDLRFRLADDADLAAVVRLRDDAARWMHTQGVTGQWQPDELGGDHFRRIMESGELWLAEAADGVVGAWELWWEDEDAWGPQPPTAGYVHRLMVDHGRVAPGTGRQLLRTAESRVAERGREWVRLDCLAGNARLTAYYLNAGYRVVGRKEGKPQPDGTPKSFALLEKSVRDGPDRSARRPQQPAHGAPGPVTVAERAHSSTTLGAAYHPPLPAGRGDHGDGAAAAAARRRGDGQRLRPTSPPRT